MKKLRHITLVILFGVIVTVLIVQQLLKLPAAPRLQSAAVQNAVTQLQVETVKKRELREQEKIDLEREDIALRNQIIQNKKETLKDELAHKRRMRESWDYAWLGAFTSFFLFLGVGLCVAIIKLVTANSDVIAMAFLAHKLTPGQERIELEKWRCMKEEMKLWGITKDAPILPEYTDVTPMKTSDALQCLEQGLMSGGQPAFFFGTTAGGDHQYEDLQPEGVGYYHVGLIGEGRIGKSNFLVNIGAQAQLKGQLVLAIDLHFPNKESFTEKFGALAHTPNFRGYHNVQDALEAIYFLEKTLDNRLSGVMPMTLGIVVICDELKNFMRQIRRLGEEFFNHVVSVLERLTEEGGKNQMSFVVASHTWRAEDLGTTAWRDLLNFRVGLRSTPRQAQTFGIEKERKNQFKNLKPGEIIYEDAGGYYHQCQVPLWTPDAIRKAAGMVCEAAWPDMHEPTQEDLNEYACNVVQIPPSEHDVLTHLRTLVDAGMKQKEIARQAQLSENQVSDILKGNVRMQTATKRKLMEVG